MTNVNAVNQDNRQSNYPQIVLCNSNRLLIQDTGFVSNSVSETEIQNGNQQAEAGLSANEQNELTSGLSGSGNQYSSPDQSYGQPVDRNIAKAVHKFRRATYCWGTKDKMMEEVLDDINSSNVIEIMKAWNKYHSKQKGESFMEAFIWDADSEQKENYCRNIAEALLERAEASGAYDEEMAELFAKIDEELDSWFYISNDISAVFDKILYKIAEAEAEQIAKNVPNEDKANVKAKALEYAKPYSQGNLSLTA